MGRTNCYLCKHSAKRSTAEPCNTCYDYVDRPNFVPKDRIINVHIFGGKTITVGLSDLAKQDALCNKLFEIGHEQLSDDEKDLFDGLKCLLGSIAGIE